MSGLDSKTLLEANASHAVGQYVTQGPSMPYEHMRITGLEGVRSRLDAHQTSATQEVSGWVCIEQAFAMACHKGFRSKYSLEPLFEAADTAFTNSLDLYDERHDPPDHLWKLELALGALPVYQTWVQQLPLERPLVRTFYEDSVGIGHKLLAIKDEYGAEWDAETRKSYGGFTSEIVTLLAYNRRNKDGFNAGPTIAVPSTYRQNASRKQGRVVNERDKSELRGNWDISVIREQAGGLALTDKLQVKSIQHLDDKPEYGKQLQEYTADITLVSVMDHLCRPLSIGSEWEALNLLVATSEPNAPRKARTAAAAITRRLYDHIAFHAEQRKHQDADKFHQYDLREPRPRTKRTTRGGGPR